MSAITRLIDSIFNIHKNNTKFDLMLMSHFHSKYEDIKTSLKYYANTLCPEYKYFVVKDSLYLTEYYINYIHTYKLDVCLPSNHMDRTVGIITIACFWLVSKIHLDEVITLSHFKFLSKTERKDILLLEHHILKCIQHRLLDFISN